MDDIDRAQEAELRAREAALEAAVAAARGITPGGGASPKESADECVECGALIPSARQIALPGVDLCVECAERLERELKMRRINGAYS